MANGVASEEGSSRRRIPLITLVVVLLLLLYWGVLFYLTHVPLPPGILPGQSDKFVHFSAYCLLAVLMMSLRATRGPFGWYSVITRWLVLAAYGAFDELTQLLVNRSCDLVDWLCDVTGAAVGLMIVARFCWRQRQSSDATETESTPVNSAAT